MKNSLPQTIHKSFSLGPASPDFGESTHMMSGDKLPLFPIHLR